MKSLEVKYETPPALPPPYCYYYHIKGQVTGNQFQVDFHWVHHNREDLAVDEVEAEGFTANDDYHWSGNLHPVWLSQFEQHIAGTKKANRAGEDHPYLHITWQEKERIQFEGEPQNLEQWEYFMQEFVQAIYETSGREAPLELHFRKISSDKKVTEAKLLVLFRDRTVQVTFPPGSSQLPASTFDWEPMQKHLQSLFLLEPDDENAALKAPTSVGYFFQTGNGFWYQPGVTAVDPSPRKKHTQSVVQFMDQLFSGK